MQPPSSFTSRYESVKRQQVIRALETVQDLIVVSLCFGLFSFMLIQLREMFLSLLPPLDFPAVTADILFLLILVELFRLLIIYLQEQRVSIGVAVEVSIVSILREVIVHGVLDAPWTQILAACSLLLVLGALMVVRVWLPPTFEGIDPEYVLSLRRNRELTLQLAQVEAEPHLGSSEEPAMGNGHASGNGYGAARLSTGLNGASAPSIHPANHSMHHSNGINGTKNLAEF